MNEQGPISSRIVPWVGWSVVGGLVFGVAGSVAGILGYEAYRATKK